MYHKNYGIKHKKRMKQNSSGTINYLSLKNKKPHK